MNHLGRKGISRPETHYNALVGCRAGCRLRDAGRHPSRAGSLPPERVESIHFTHFSNFRDYLASATCLKIKNIPVLEHSICFSCTDPSTRAVGLFLGTVCSEEQLLTGSVPKKKLGIESGRERGERKLGGVGGREVQMASPALSPPCSLQHQRQSPETRRPGWDLPSPRPRGSSLQVPTSTVQLLHGHDNVYISGTGILLGTDSEDAG